MLKSCLGRVVPSSQVKGGKFEILTAWLFFEITLNLTRQALKQIDELPPSPGQPSVLLTKLFWRIATCWFSLVCCQHLTSLFSVCIGSQYLHCELPITSCLWGYYLIPMISYVPSFSSCLTSEWQCSTVNCVDIGKILFFYQTGYPNVLPSPLVLQNLMKDFTPISYWCFWIEEIWVPRKNQQHLSKEFLVLTECLLNSPTNPFHKPVSGRNLSVTSARKRHKWRTLSDGH